MGIVQHIKNKYIYIYTYPNTEIGDWLSQIVLNVRVLVFLHSKFAVVPKSKVFKVTWHLKHSIVSDSGLLVTSFHKCMCTLTYTCSG